MITSMLSHHVVPPTDKRLGPTRLPLVKRLVSKVEAHSSSVQSLGGYSSHNPCDDHIRCGSTACWDTDFEVELPVLDAESIHFVDHVDRSVVSDQDSAQMTKGVWPAGGECEAEGFLITAPRNPLPFHPHAGAPCSASRDAELGHRVVERHRRQHGRYEAHPFAPFHPFHFPDSTKGSVHV